MRIGYRILRRRDGFSRISPQSSGEIGRYILTYGKITRNGRKGLFQFALSQSRGRAIPHIFFTCPQCGAINKDLLSIESIINRMDSGYGRLIRSCHNCGACGVAIPYTLRMSPSKLRKKYYALLREVKKGEPV